MATFFQQIAETIIAKHIDRFPLLKLQAVIDWNPIRQSCNNENPDTVRIIVDARLMNR